MDYEIHHLYGLYQCLLKNFLLNYSLSPMTIWMTRHGESLYNLENRIGGNPGLSDKGRRYARALGKFVELHPDIYAAQITTSCLVRTHQTIEFCPNRHKMELSLLNEINAGSCENMTYQEIKEQIPEVHEGRNKDKLGFRYPGGESYIDMLRRLHPLVLEFERTHKPYFIVGHQAVLRILLAYFYTLENAAIPFLDIPLHAIFRFESTHFGYKETQYMIDLDKFDAGEEIFWTEKYCTHTR
jgi:broad specificity phosphatase PhoE